MKFQKKSSLFVCTLFALLCVCISANAQKEVTKTEEAGMLTIEKVFASPDYYPDRAPAVKWMKDGRSFLTREPSSKYERATDVILNNIDKDEKKVLVKAEDLVPKGSDKPIRIRQTSLSDDESKLLFFTNTKRVWRSNTKGDYWVYDLKSKKLKQLGKDLPESSLMFAKFSPDNEYVAYVSQFNIYAENFKTGEVVQLTKDGTESIINGTFDWVYEEEFNCRDGFRWSPDGKTIAFWQLDASEIGTFFMINNTDSIYSKPIPVQYPKAGEDPSSCKVGVIDFDTKKIKWIPVPGGEKENFLPRIKWVDKDNLLIQQMNRKQNQMTIWKYNLGSEKIEDIYIEKEDTWVDISYPDFTSNDWGMDDLFLLSDNKSFLRMTENDGWRHVYKIPVDGGKKKLITPGDYDVATIYGLNDEHLFFSASPNNSTQRYLYRVSLDGKGDTLRLTPKQFSGMNEYNVSPSCDFAIHDHSNIKTPPSAHLVDLKKHKTVKTFVDNKEFIKRLGNLKMPEETMFTVTTADGIEIDGKMIKPLDFDPKKKYPVLFNVYGEPAGCVAGDNWNRMWPRMIAQKGYVVIAMDNRGTPCLKGSEWRKSIYRKIGVINSRDQAMAAKEILKWDFIDPERIAVWGWSGGGSMTLNLLFRYPEIYKTGMSVAPVGNQLYYDNIYQERYMGLPSENLEDFVEGSPVTYAKNLEGNLLIVHGTGDDNVHYQNTEAIVNELIANNIQFDMMAYPNRSHGIYEGRNTYIHLHTLLTNYLLEHVEAGGK